MKGENRRKIKAFVDTLPFMRKRHRIAPPKLVGHSQWADFLEREFNKPGMRVLEIGSRVVTGANHRSRFAQADYVGFDFYPGENVDVVGDAHRLTEYFPTGEKFDLIFASAVFEHLHMPWVAAMSLSRHTFPISRMSGPGTSTSSRTWACGRCSTLVLATT